MRLIDADELINQGYEIVVDGLQYDTCNKSIDIDNIPTAYDVDKVVEELEKIRAKKTCNKEKCDSKEICRICVVDDPIEIVKKGGVINVLHLFHLPLRSRLHHLLHKFCKVLLYRIFLYYTFSLL